MAKTIQGRKWIRMDQQQNEFGVFSSQVGEMLDINPNTLRTWSLELEKFDYKFERNKRSQRIYYKQDIEVLREMKNLMNTGTYTIQESIKQVLESKELTGANARTGSVLERTNAVMTKDEAPNALNQMGMAYFETASAKMNVMVEQQSQILMQNKQIVNMLLDERAAKEQAEIDRELEKRENEKLRDQLDEMQSKIDKIFEYVEDGKGESKSFLQKLFNRSPKKSL
ncbi:hypothetical protein CON09_06410 [Bacillus anthracis]|nr:hypothetical protein CON09_06410 [Bacillus anthracis]PEY18914.1 hypothetical protein CN340_27275 [Bacillus anthracis]